MNMETASENVRPMDEAVKYAAVPNQKNEASIEAGLLPEGSIDIAYANV